VYKFDPDLQQIRCRRRVSTVTDLPHRSPVILNTSHLRGMASRGNDGSFSHRQLVAASTFSETYWTMSISA